MNNKNTNIRYINDTTAQVTKAFAKNASIFGTEEFKLWREYLTYFPKANMVTKSIKKNPNKLNITKNMTYENMAAYIREQDDAEAVMKEFQKQINLSKVKANPYRSVLAWFKQKYTDVNDYMDFFTELAEKEQRENDIFHITPGAEAAPSSELAACSGF